MKVTTKKCGEDVFTSFEISVNGEYFGTWFGCNEEDAISFAERNWKPEEGKQMSNEYKQCRICGRNREDVKLRMEIGYIGVHLCNACYCEEKILRRD